MKQNYPYLFIDFANICENILAIRNLVTNENYEVDIKLMELVYSDINNPAEKK